MSEKSVVYFVERYSEMYGIWMMAGVGLEYDRSIDAVRFRDSYLHDGEIVTTRIIKHTKVYEVVDL